MMKQAILPIKIYSDRYPNTAPPLPLTPSGKVRRTGYVLFDFGDINHGKGVSRKWFQNKLDAKIEQYAPCINVERGIIF